MSKTFDIEKVAIIGAGPGGLTTLNELLHTSKDGTSTITNPSANSVYPNIPAFKEIVVFEQNNKIGGVWNYSEETDQMFPTNVDDYSKPNGFRPKLTEGLVGLESRSFNDPLVIPATANLLKKSATLWNRSALYDHLFTNIPNEVMRYSTSFDEKVKLDKNSNIYEPFATRQNVIKYIADYAEKYGLEKYVRLNSSVEKLYKKDNKWYITVCNFDKISKTFNYYTETFDAVVISIGRFNIPFYPKIEGMEKFNKEHPGIISHSKSFRKTDDLKGKKILFVGSGISALDIAQYLIPVADVHISCNTEPVSKEAESNECTEKTKPWTKQVMDYENIRWKKHCRISKFYEDAVEFEDGTKEVGFDKILFCTGYHLYYPFLDIPENKGKEYISIYSGVDGNSNCAMTKVDNLYLYVFTISDPTLCHTGLAQNPLFFLTSEANAVAIAGVWSNSKKLPSIEEQRKFIKNRFKDKKSGFQTYDENTIGTLINECYKLSPTSRFNFLPYINADDITKSKEVLCSLFVKFANGELDESDPSTQYSEN